MNFIKTINYEFINWNDVSIIGYENEGSIIYSYFYLKNGQKFDAYESVNYFDLDKDEEYEFCCMCHAKYIEILIEWINIHFRDPESIFDVELFDSIIQDNFIKWARENTEKLRKIRIKE